MNIISIIQKCISKPGHIIPKIVLSLGKYCPDKIYLQMLYYSVTDKKLDLSNPKTFNEKLQWLKLYDRKPEYQQMVDKAESKNYVSKIIGEKHIIPTLGIWDNFDEIDFNSLPDKFVLKTTHDSGGVVICRDKASFDIENAKLKLSKSLKNNFYWQFREWPYKNVKPRILAEELIELPDNADLMDFKLHCFNGKVQFIKVDFGRFTEHHANYYDPDWNLLPFGLESYPPLPEFIIPKPQYLSEMKEFAEKLSRNHSFLRVDLYTTDNNIYFGELTFFPGAGLNKFTSKEWEEKVGDMIKLPNDAK